MGVFQTQAVRHLASRVASAAFSLLLASAPLGCCAPCNSAQPLPDVLAVPEKEFVCERQLPLPDSERDAFVTALAELHGELPASDLRVKLRPMIDLLSDADKLKLVGFAERVAPLANSSARPRAVDATQEKSPVVPSRRVAVPSGGFWFVFYVDPGAPAISYSNLKVFKEE